MHAHTDGRTHNRHNTMTIHCWPLASGAKKQYKSSITKNHKTEKKFFFYGDSLKGYVAYQVVFRFCARNQTKQCGKIE